MPLRLIIIHGLNNSTDAFLHLKEALSERGFDCHLLCLPGHGHDRDEVKDFRESTAAFDRSMRKLINGPYAVVAFSQGALNLQMWLRDTTTPKPIAQVLLAPAISIRRSELIQRILRLLPPTVVIKSQLPENLRRFSHLYVRDYRTLFEGAHGFNSTLLPFEVPTQIIIDPKDELVDAQRLKKLFHDRVTFFERPYLRGRRPGKYHAIFHPEYFEDKDWERLVGLISQFIETQKVALTKIKKSNDG